jgi:AraC-like DNA-binding protein
MAIADTIRKPSNPASEAGTRERSELLGAPPTFAAGFRSGDLEFDANGALRRHRATPAASITELAHDAGFVHLGRFSDRYRRAYGESPSQTLQRSLRRA